VMLWLDEGSALGSPNEGVVAAHECRAVIFANTQRRNAAILAYGDALAAIAACPGLSPVWESVLVRNMAALHTAMGDHDQALALYEERIRAAGANPEDKAGLLVLLRAECSAAYALAGPGHYRNARLQGAPLLRALERCDDFQFDQILPEAERVLTSLITGGWTRGVVRLASRFLERIGDDPEWLPERAAILTHKGCAERQLGRYEAAIRSAEQAVRCVGESGLEGWAVEVRIFEAETLDEGGYPRRAEQRLTALAMAVGRARRGEDSPELREIYFRVQGELVNFYRGRHRLAEAERVAGILAREFGDSMPGDGQAQDRAALYRSHTALQLQGDLAKLRGDFSEAKQRYGTVYRALRTNRAADRGEIARLAISLGRVALQQDDYGRVQRYLSQARAQLRHLLPGALLVTRAALSELAASLAIKLEQTEEADRHFGRAQRFYERAYGERNSPALAWVLCRRAELAGAESGGESVKQLERAWRMLSQMRSIVHPLTHTVLVGLHQRGAWPLHDREPERYLRALRRKIDGLTPPNIPWD
jgi:tetratricopeptide (TPR) repeat protein